MKLLLLKIKLQIVIWYIISYGIIKGQFSLSFQVQGGFIIPHTKDVEYVRKSRPIGFSLSIIKPTSSSAYLICRCYPKHLLSYMWFNYDNKVLGQGHHLFYTLESGFRLNKKIFFVFSGSSGFHYGTKPYHPLKNPNNISYSMYVNGYLGASMGLDWTRKKSILFFRLTYHHISNGGIKDPNKGINWPVISIGYTWHLSDNNNNFKNIQDTTTNYTTFFNENKQLRTFSCYYSSRIISKGDKKRWDVFGLAISYIKRLSQLSAGWIEGDMHIDKAVDEIIKRNSLNESPLFLSIASGHGFILGKFFFYQGIGFYGIRPVSLYPIWYHRWGLQYHWLSTFYTEIRLKAHYHIAHFLDLRVGVKF